MPRKRYCKLVLRCLLFFVLLISLLLVLVWSLLPLLLLLLWIRLFEVLFVLISIGIESCVANVDDNLLAKICESLMTHVALVILPVDDAAVDEPKSLVLPQIEFVFVVVLLSELPVNFSDAIVNVDGA